MEKVLHDNQELLDYVLRRLDDLWSLHAGGVDVSKLCGFYRKYARVQADQAGEEMVGKNLSTIMADGYIEVQDAVISNASDWIVVNPNGEAYVVKDEKFRDRYEVEVGLDGKHAPIGGVNCFLQVDEDIIFMVPWGEGGSLIPFNLKRGGFLNVTGVDLQKPVENLDIYGIQEKEFYNTYAKCDKNGVFFDSDLRKAFGQKLDEDEKEM